MTDAFPDAGKLPELAWLPTDRLDVDPAYQRKLDSVRSQRQIARIAANFRWSCFQAISATPAPDQRWLIIDGQHRVAAARLIKIKHLPSVVIPDADQAAQAEAFVWANKERSPVSAQALYHARLVARRTAALAHRADLPGCRSYCRKTQHRGEATGVSAYRNGPPIDRGVAQTLRRTDRAPDRDVDCFCVGR